MKRFTMKRCARYVVSRWIEILVLFLTIVIIAFVLHTSAVATNVIRLIVLTLGMLGVVWLVAGYMRLARTWDFYDRLGNTDAPLDIVNDAPRSFAPEYRSTQDAIEAISNDAHRRLSAVSNESREWREYIESWVHEIKTPIAAARLGLENNPGVGGARMATQIDRIGFYVEQALFFARSASVDRDYIISEIDVYRVISEAVRERKQTLIAAGMSVDISGVERTARVMGDDKWLIFMIGQIVDNAAKYRCPDRTPCLYFDFLYEGEGVNRYGVITVRDNGLGITAHDLPRIFDKGFTGAHGRGREPKATGIGLYLVKNLAEKMGMSVRAESVEGEGSAISLILPLP